MGFFDKIKNAVNKITGGGATVTVSFVGDKMLEPIKVNITAVVKDAPIDIAKVYLKVRSVEKVRLPKREVSSEQMFDVNIDKEIYKTQELVVVPTPQKLEAGQTYNWSIDVSLNPQMGAKPTYLGMYVSHEWEFQAGLDAKGNDPDSGWVAHILN